NVPYRLRVRLSRKRNEDEDSANKLYTLVTYVPVTTCKERMAGPQWRSRAKTTLFNIQESVRP
ncbi:hypothetical protein CRUP_006055, partial [Coryphaenoides rupestris]